MTQGKDGMAMLKLDRKEIAKGSVGGAFATQPNDSLSVGSDSGSPVTDYGKSKSYSDEISQVSIELKK